MSLICCNFILHRSWQHMSWHHMSWRHMSWSHMSWCHIIYLMQDAWCMINEAYCTMHEASFNVLDEYTKFAFYNIKFWLKTAENWISLKSCYTQTHAQTESLSSLYRWHLLHMNGHTESTLAWTEYHFNIQTDTLNQPLGGQNNICYIRTDTLNQPRVAGITFATFQLHKTVGTMSHLMWL